MDGSGQDAFLQPGGGGQPNDLYSAWIAAHEAGRAAICLELASDQFDLATQIEHVACAAPSSAQAALVTLRMAVRLMQDEGDHPSYAHLLEAALRQLKDALAQPPERPQA